MRLSPDFDRDRTLWVAGNELRVSTDAGRTFSDPLLTDYVRGLAIANNFTRTQEIFVRTAGDPVAL